MCSSFLTRTLCLRILSLCLSRDVHFSHDFQLQKNQFLQLFRPFSLTARTPIIFPFQRAFFAHDIPHQNPLHFPHLSSLSGGILRSHTSQSMTHSFPRISSLLGETYRAIFVQSIVLFAKIPYFFVQISACPDIRAGRLSGGEQGEI